MEVVFIIGKGDGDEGELCYGSTLVRVEIRELRPEVVAESDEVLVHY